MEEKKEAGGVQPTASEPAVRYTGSSFNPDKRKNLIKKIIGIGLALFLIIFAYAFFSSPDTGCDSREARSLLGKLVKKGLKQEVGAWGQIYGGDPGEIQGIIDHVDISVDQIATIRKEAQGCSCQAVVTMAAPNQNKKSSTFAIKYSTSLSSDKKNVYVELDANTLLGKLIFGGRN